MRGILKRCSKELVAKWRRCTGSRIGRGIGDERGSVSVEFALTVPAIIAVLAVIVGGIYLGALKIALTSVAGEVARLEARGEDSGAQIASAPIGVTVAREENAGIRCITLTADSPLAMQTSAKSCATVIKEE